jgi:hypothetical protein
MGTQVRIGEYIDERFVSRADMVSAALRQSEKI